MGRLRCKTKFFQGYGTRIPGLRKGGGHSYSQWSQKFDMRKWRQIFCLMLLDFLFFFLIFILTNDKEEVGLEVYLLHA